MAGGAGFRTRSKEAAQPMQLTLFELVAGNDGADARRSQCIEMYDLAPRFVLYTLGRLRQGAHLETILRDFVYRGHTYSLILKPARVSRMVGGRMATVEMYPGEREQILEDVVRRLAVEGGRLSLDGNNIIRVTVSLREIYHELERVSRTLSFGEIREAIEILNETNITISNLDDRRAKLLKFSPFSEVRFSLPKGRSEGGAWDDEGMTSIVLNTIVTEALRDMAFRQVDYEKLMSIRDPFARWIYKRLSLVPQETPIIAMTASEIARDSGLAANWSRWRDSVRRITTAVNVLVQPGILERVVEHRDTAKNKLVDMTYQMHLSPEFMAGLRRSREVMESNRKRLETELVQNGDGSPRFIPKTAAETRELRASLAISPD
jgi:hypothetical protein